jgi:hypothetical protein
MQCGDYGPLSLEIHHALHLPSGRRGIGSSGKQRGCEVS